MNTEKWQSRANNKLLCFLLLAMACSAIMLNGCKKNDNGPPSEPEEPKPTADFTMEQVADDDPFSFSFSNAGTNFQLVRWEFGDDSVSLDQSPTHTFLRTGNFRVTLRNENNQGYWAEKETVIQIVPDSLIEVVAIPASGGTLDLRVDAKMAIDSLFWYKGENSTTELISHANNVNVAVQTGQFQDYTLRVKTPNGSFAEITRLLTDLGIVRDLTDDHGIFSVSRDNDGGQFAGEGSLKLIDNSTDTKFLQFNFSGDLWWQLEYFDPVVLGAYTFTSANDASGRDPKNWKLEGSQDGTNWSLLDEQTDQVFEDRFFTKTYIFENSTAYRFYRVSVTSVVEGGLFQLAEFRVLQLPQE